MTDIAAVLKLPRLSVAILGGIAALVLTAMLPQSAQAAPHQQFANVSGCSPAALYRVNFPAVPAGRAFDITSVSCSITIGNQTVEVLQASLNIVRASGNVVIVRDTLLPVLQGRNGLGSWFSINQQTLDIVPAAHYPQVAISADLVSSFFGHCKISGNLR